MSLRKPIDGSAMTLAHRPGFTLIEVVLAVGVFSFALLALVGLLGPLLNSMNAASDRGVAVDAMGRIDAELQDMGLAELGPRTSLNLYTITWQEEAAGAVTNFSEVGTQGEVASRMSTVLGRDNAQLVGPPVWAEVVRRSHPEPGSANEDELAAVRFYEVRLRVLGVPDPDASASGWLGDRRGDLADQDPDFVFSTAVLR